MKKILAMLVGILVLATPVMAAIETVEILPVEPGITPDSPLYAVDKTMEKIQLKITTNEVKRAELRYKFAEERLNEAKKMTDEDKTEFVDELMVEYENELNETNNEIEKAVARGRNITDVAEHVATMTAKHLEVLQGVYEKVPEQAKSAIAHAMEVSVRKQVGVLAHMENGEKVKEKVQAEVQAKIEERVSAEIKERVKQNANQAFEKNKGKVETENDTVNPPAESPVEPNRQEMN